MLFQQDETPVRNFVELFGRKPAVVWHDDKLGETLSMFRQQRAHMALVRDVKGEDVVSEIAKKLIIFL
jgi:CBS domain containing-hemolysin-like protein